MDGQSERGREEVGTGAWERLRPEAAGSGEADGEQDGGLPEVRDAYVARRVAAYRAASAEAGVESLEQGGAAGAETRFGSYILLGLFIASLLVLFIYAVTRTEFRAQRRPPVPRTSARPLDRPRSTLLNGQGPQLARDR